MIHVGQQVGLKRPMQRKLHAIFASAMGAVFAIFASGGAHAAEDVGIAKDWQMGFQVAASPVMERIDSLHDFLLIIITLITLFVLFLLLYCIFKFNEKANPTPSKTTHNTLLEVAWTGIPILILIVIAVPSFKLLYFMDRHENPDMTIKVTGHQWYWSYEYPDHGNFTFDSYMLQDDDLQPGQPRLLSVDEEVVLPVDTNIRILQTAGDVIHNWAMPALGLKQDAIPGRTNENWVRITKPGKYYGQCSELCGVGHAYMPAVIRAVSKEEFATWVEQAKEQYAKVDGYEDEADKPDVKLAQAAQ